MSAFFGWRRLRTSSYQGYLRATLSLMKPMPSCGFNAIVWPWYGLSWKVCGWPAWQSGAKPTLKRPSRTWAVGPYPLQRGGRRAHQGALEVVEGFGGGEEFADEVAEWRARDHVRELRAVHATRILATLLQWWNRRSGGLGLCGATRGYVARPGDGSRRRVGLRLCGWLQGGSRLAVPAPRCCCPHCLPSSRCRRRCCERRRGRRSRRFSPRHTRSLKSADLS